MWIGAWQYLSAVNTLLPLTEMHFCCGKSGSRRAKLKIPAGENTRYCFASYQLTFVLCGGDFGERASTCEPFCLPKPLRLHFDGVEVLPGGAVERARPFRSGTIWCAPAGVWCVSGRGGIKPWRARRPILVRGDDLFCMVPPTIIRGSTWSPQRGMIAGDDCW